MLGRRVQHDVLLPEEQEQALSQPQPQAAHAPPQEEDLPARRPHASGAAPRPPQPGLGAGRTAAPAPLQGRRPRGRSGCHERCHERHESGLGLCRSRRRRPPAYGRGGGSGGRWVSRNAGGCSSDALARIAASASDGTAAVPRNVEDVFAVWAASASTGEFNTLVCRLSRTFQPSKGRTRTLSPCDCS